MSAVVFYMRPKFGSLLGLILISGMNSPSQPSSRLVNLQTLDPSLVIDARYAKPDNFVGRALYPGNQLFLLDLVARDLVSAQAEFRRLGTGLKIWDGYRPLSVQKKMWTLIPDERYVADPAKGSNHNRGCAVDVTLVDKNGRELPMPTGFDDFSDKAHRDYNKLSSDVLRNRALLSDVMQRHHFVPFATEWWHFDHEGSSQFPVLDLDPFKAHHKSD